MVADLDLRALCATIDLDDDDLGMRVDDGDIAVRLTTGVGGTYADAIAGAERLAAGLDQFLALLKTRAGSADPFPRPVPVVVCELAADHQPGS
ncbi:hypothetical protein [Dactylosporangium matsuzakiense]|uniref:hypothetical protein n=1 Tax=Dactylosporangium matsuzakiense TaxID=53360 RepID=UPI0022F2DB39|nr:hypothetical protein [Dactylosporangium matsuzakiense]